MAGIEAILQRHLGLKLLRRCPGAQADENSDGDWILRQGGRYQESHHKQQNNEPDFGSRKRKHDSISFE